MATLIVDHTTAGSISDADFRLLIVNTRLGLTAAGWVQTSDTGQVNAVSVTKPVSGSLNGGYDIWRMADALQATVPIFLKVGYWTGVNSSAIGCKWQVASSTDGAGTLTGSISSLFDSTGATGVAVSTIHHHRFCGNTGRFGVSHWFSNGSPVEIYGGGWSGSFHIERTRSTDGSVNGEGVVLTSWCCSTSGAIPMQQTLRFGKPLQAVYYPAHCLTPGSSLDGSDATVYPIFPWSLKQFPPMLGLIGYFKTDFTTGLALAIQMYGVNHTYVPMGIAGPPYYCSTVIQSGTTASWMMLWE